MNTGSNRSVLFQINHSYIHIKLIITTLILCSDDWLKEFLVLAQVLNPLNRLFYPEAEGWDKHLIFFDMKMVQLKDTELFCNKTLYICRFLLREIYQHETNTTVPNQNSASTEGLCNLIRSSKNSSKTKNEKFMLREALKKKVRGIITDKKQILNFLCPNEILQRSPKTHLFGNL